MCMCAVLGLIALGLGLLLLRRIRRHYRFGTWRLLFSSEQILDWVRGKEICLLMAVGSQ